MSLVVTSLTKHFGGLKAVDGVDLTVERGSVVGLVGPNGAGKTTCFNLITGFLPPTSGHVELDGTDITRTKVERRQAMGISRTFQQTTLFGGLTTAENVMLALHRNNREPLWRALAPIPTHLRHLRGIAQEHLDRLGIGHVADISAQALSYGDQRLLAIAVALSSEPNYLLLDEPAAGLNPRESARLSDLLARLRFDGLGVLIVEHDMPLIMKTCDHILVLASGQPLAAGTPAEIRSNPDVIEAYLGRSA